MKLLIDGNNLIFKFPHLEEFMYKETMAGAREGLIELMADYRSRFRRPDDILIFFDGRKNSEPDLLEESVNGIRIYYSQEDAADDLLKDYIKMNLHPSDLTLVTSDKDILFYARRFKVKSHTSEAFAAIINQRLNEPEETKDEEVHLNSEETGFWQQLFRKKNR